MTDEFLATLVCPLCKGGPLYSTTDDEEGIACSACKTRYRLTNGIPDLLPPHLAEIFATESEEWSDWSQKLTNFVQWRKLTWNGSAGADKLDTYVQELKEAFIVFSGLRDSGKRVIDIGCGDGGMRLLLGDCSYCGVDPLLIDGQPYEFSMIRGVGEYLPFATGSYDAAILNQVLDHCNSIDGVLEEVMRVLGPKGSVHVMQYIAEPDSLATRVYNKLLQAYLWIKGVKNLDTKTSRFNRRGIEPFFRERFEHVDLLEYSPTQVFVKASAWKQNRK